MQKLNLVIVSVAVLAAFTQAFADDAATLLKKKTVASQNYVDTKLETKQPILDAKSGDYVVLYPKTGDGAGVVGQREIVSDTATYDGRSTELLTAGVANRLLQIKQDAIQGTANNVGDVITYNGSLGATAFKPVYKSSGTYNAQKNALVEAEQVNSAISEGFNAHLTCAGTSDGVCVLYRINTLGSTYFPQNQ